MTNKNIVTSITAQSHNIWILLNQIINNYDETSPQLRPGFGYAFYITGAALFEGLLYQTLTKIIESDPKIKFKNRKAIYLSAFGGYNDFYKQYTGKKLLKHFEPENWKAIFQLFEIRNHLAHGQDIKVTKSESSDFIMPEKIKSFHNYLIEKKLKQKNNLKEILIIDIFEKEIYKHFYEQLRIAWDTLEEEYKLIPTYHHCNYPEKEDGQIPNIKSVKGALKGLSKILYC